MSNLLRERRLNKGILIKNAVSLQKPQPYNKQLKSFKTSQS